MGHITSSATSSCLGLFFLLPPPPPWSLSSDDSDNDESDSQIVSIVDTTAPDFALSVLPGSLWPPNHNLVNVGLTASATDNCGTPTVTYEVWCDEDDETRDGGDGDDAERACGETRVAAIVLHAIAPAQPQPENRQQRPTRRARDPERQQPA